MTPKPEFGLVTVSTDFPTHAGDIPVLRDNNLHEEWGRSEVLPPCCVRDAADRRAASGVVLRSDGRAPGAGAGVRRRRTG